MRIVEYILFGFIGGLSLMQLEIGADRLTQNRVSKILLSVQNLSYRVHAPKIRV